MIALFSVLIVIQFVVVVIHDWLEIPGWTHGRQIRAVVGAKKLAWATAINAIFPGLAVAYLFWYWSRPLPRFVANYWLIYCLVTVISAVAMWYVPYLFGSSLDRKSAFSRMYAGTGHPLRPRNGDNGPNTLHICFHVLFLATLGLSTAIWLRR